MSSELKLNCGTDIYLAAINQSLTYEGLLEGLPTKEMNQRTVDNAVMRSTRFWGKTHLITPVETLWDDPKDYFLGQPASIPDTEVRSLWQTRYQSTEDYDYQFLAIVWYQQEFAMPIDPSVVQQIQELDWNTLASPASY